MITQPVNKKLSDLFGMGAKRVKLHPVQNIPVDVDEAIAEAVLMKHTPQLCLKKNLRLSLTDKRREKDQ